MPSINDSRKVIKSSIPSIEGGEIELWDSMTMGDIEKVGQTVNTTARGLAVFLALVKSWNLEEPCTEENIKKLSVADINHLISLTSYGSQKTEEVIEDEKFEKKNN